MIKTNLAILMAERGLKIADVYDATGISKTTLMAISENTGKGIQYETVDKLCNFLGVTPQEFFSYAPYIFTFYKSKAENDLSKIAITVNHSGNLKSFNFSPFIITPKSPSYPVIPNDADFIVNYDIETNFKNIHKSQSDKKEFYKIYDNLPVNLKSDINNHFLNIATDNLSKLSGQEIDCYDVLFDENNTEPHKLKIKSGMKAIINLFGDRFSRIITIPLFIVHEENKTKH